MGNQQQNTNTNPQNVYDTQKSQTDVNRSLYNVMKRYSNKSSSTIPQDPLNLEKEDKEEQEQCHLFLSISTQ